MYFKKSHSHLAQSRRGYSKTRELVMLTLRLIVIKNFTQKHLPRHHRKDTEVGTELCSTFFYLLKKRTSCTSASNADSWLTGCS